jgi:hypothetical protein
MKTAFNRGKDGRQQDGSRRLQGLSGSRDGWQWHQWTRRQLDDANDEGIINDNGSNNSNGNNKDDKMTTTTRAALERVAQRQRRGQGRRQTLTLLIFNLNSTLS